MCVHTYIRSYSHINIHTYVCDNQKQIGLCQFWYLFRHQAITSIFDSIMIGQVCHISINSVVYLHIINHKNGFSEVVKPAKSIIMIALSVVFPCISSGTYTYIRTFNSSTWYLKYW